VYRLSSVLSTQQQVAKARIPLNQVGQLRLYPHPHPRGDNITQVALTAPPPFRSSKRCVQCTGRRPPRSRPLWQTSQSRGCCLSKCTTALPFFLIPAMTRCLQHKVPEGGRGEQEAGTAKVVTQQSSNSVAPFCSSPHRGRFCCPEPQTESCPDRSDWPARGALLAL
jgi:hypothetical protein